MRKLNTSSILSLVFLGGILILINAIGIRYFVRADLTSSKMYSLSDASKQVVGGLEDKLLVKAYFSPNLPGNYAGVERYLRDMLEDYQAYSKGMLDYEFIDPGDENALEQEAQAFNIPPRQFQTVANDKIEVVRGYTGIVFIYGDKKEAIPVIDEVGNLEYEITSLINRLTANGKNILGVILGRDPNMQMQPEGQEIMQQLYERLGRNYDVRPVNPSNSLPKDMNGLLVIAPKEPFTDWQLFNIDQYIMNGGKVGMFVNSYVGDLNRRQAAPIQLNLGDFLGNYGLALGEDLLSDANSATISVQTQQGFFTMNQPIKVPYFPRITTFNPDNIITRDLQVVQTFFPSSVDTTLAEAKGFEASGLMYTSEYTARDSGPYVMLDIFNARTKEDFPEKHVPVAAVVRGTFSSYFADRGVPEPDSEDMTFDGELKRSCDAENRLLVVGDGNMCLDSYLSTGSLVFIENAVDWLVQSETLIAIRSKQIPQKPLKDIPAFARKLVRWANLFGPSILIIILGIVLWQTRRIKKKALMSQA